MSVAEKAAIQRLQAENNALRTQLTRYRCALEIIAQGKNDPIGVNSDIAEKALESHG